MTKKTSLILITSITATFVAICAAVFSVTGIAKLFAGAALSAAIMAAALELGKIVSISFLYQYWTDIPKTLKIYLTTAATILMFITSAGIYGYLTSAYAAVSATPTRVSAEIQSLETKQKSVQSDIDRKTARLTQLIELRSQQENRVDQLISKSQTGSNSTVKAAQSTLSQSDRTIAELQKELSTLESTRDSIAISGISKQVEIDTNADIGSFLYISKMFNVTLDTVVKWFTLIVVLVFDPLAVALVIAVNFLLKQNTNSVIKRDEPIEEPYDLYVPPTPPPTPSAENTLPVILDEDQSREDPNIYTKIINKYLDLNKNGVPDWMEPTFNWDNTASWINNPIARIYKQNIIDK